MRTMRVSRSTVQVRRNVEAVKEDDYFVFAVCQTHVFIAWVQFKISSGVLLALSTPFRRITTSIITPGQQHDRLITISIIPWHWSHLPVNLVRHAVESVRSRCISQVCTSVVYRRFGSVCIHFHCIWRHQL
jgi:hypothetical protein